MTYSAFEPGNPTPPRYPTPGDELSTYIGGSPTTTETLGVAQYEAAITPQNLQAAITAANTYVPIPNNPYGNGCGQVQYSLDTNKYRLVGIEHGQEGEGTGLNYWGANESLLEVYTNYISGTSAPAVQPVGGTSTPAAQSSVTDASKAAAATPASTTNADDSACASSEAAPGLLAKHPVPCTPTGVAYIADSTGSGAPSSPTPPATNVPALPASTSASATQPQEIGAQPFPGPARSSYSLQPSWSAS